MSNIQMEEIEENVRCAYNQIATKYNSAYAENDLFDYSYLKCFIENLKGYNVLDMGCGCGESTSYLDKNGLNVIGVDFSENMLMEAKRMYPKLKFENQNILSTTFKNESFDGIVLTYVINHFNDIGLKNLKREIDRLLKKDGVIFLSVHMGNSEEFLADPLDANVKIYYNFFGVDKLDTLFSGYTRIQFDSRESFGAEEFLCDKMFITYRKD